VPARQLGSVHVSPRNQHLVPGSGDHTGRRIGVEGRTAPGRTAAPRAAFARRAGGAAGKSSGHARTNRRTDVFLGSGLGARRNQGDFRDGREQAGHSAEPARHSPGGPRWVEPARRPAPAGQGRQRRPEAQAEKEELKARSYSQRILGGVVGCTKLPSGIVTRMRFKRPRCDRLLGLVDRNHLTGRFAQYRLARSRRQLFSPRGLAGAGSTELLLAPRPVR
jgi:hypothetical protein